MHHQNQILQALVLNLRIGAGCSREQFWNTNASIWKRVMFTVRKAIRGGIYIL